MVQIAPSCKTEDCYCTVEQFVSTLIHYIISNQYHVKMCNLQVIIPLMTVTIAVFHSVGHVHTIYVPNSNMHTTIQRVYKREQSTPFCLQIQTGLL